jgi:hypothetical protein
MKDVSECAESLTNHDEDEEPGGAANPFGSNSFLLEES